MNRLRALVALTLCLSGCQRQGPEASQTYFWQVTGSALEWGQCGDSQMLRGGVAPIAIADNSYLIYKVDSTGKKAISQACPQRDVSTCTDSTTHIVFDVVGTELTWSSEHKEPVAGSSCSIDQIETWTLTDHLSSMSLEIDTILSLVDSAADCVTLERNVKADSTNGYGITGCVVTRKLVGTLK